MEKQITKIVELQNEFNKKVNKEWVKADYKWKTAILVESAELIDSCSYKWWKHQTMDIENVKVEYVDILHFLVSYSITKFGIENTIELFNKHSDDYIYSLTGNNNIIIDSVMLFNKELLNDNFEEAVSWFAYTGSLLFDKFDDIFYSYFSKNVLNHFRNINGYKEGTYKKHWNYNGSTVEDNVVVMELMKLGFTDFNLTLEKLDEIYKGI